MLPHIDNTHERQPDYSKRQTRWRSDACLCPRSDERVRLFYGLDAYGMRFDPQKGSGGYTGIIRLKNDAFANAAAL